MIWLNEIMNSSYFVHKSPSIFGKVNKPESQGFTPRQAIRDALNVFNYYFDKDGSNIIIW